MIDKSDVDDRSVRKKKRTRLFLVSINSLTCAKTFCQVSLNDSRLVCGQSAFALNSLDFCLQISLMPSSSYISPALEASLCRYLRTFLCSFLDFEDIVEKFVSTVYNTEFLFCFRI